MPSRRDQIKMSPEEIATPNPFPSSTIPVNAHPVADRVVRFADGSRVAPIEDALVVVSEVHDERVAVQLERGTIDVEVTPRSTREFAIEVGAVRVVVLGTAFRVTRLPDDRVTVSVDRGRVRIHWAGGAAELEAGASGVYPPTNDEDALEESSVAARASRPFRSEHRGVAWRPLAQRGEYAAAFESLQREGDSVVRDDVEDLLLAADAARLSGHPARALPWLERIERRHARDARAALASFTRGRLLLTLNRPAQAAEVFERLLARGALGSLSEDVLARAIEAHDRTGNRQRANELGRRYLASFPEGRWRTRVEATLERFE